MPRRSLAIALVLCSSACLSGEAVDTEEDPLGETVHASVSSAMGPDGDEQDNICDALPHCGPCSLLCDRDALIEQYVPPHSCVAFLCELTDGRQVAVHACSP